MDIFPSAMELRDLVRTQAANTGVALALITAKAIYTGAVAGNAVTASINYTSATSDQFQSLMGELVDAGYAVTPGSTTFTVGWPS